MQIYGTVGINIWIVPMIKIECFGPFINEFHLFLHSSLNWLHGFGKLKWHVCERESTHFWDGDTPHLSILEYVYVCMYVYICALFNVSGVFLSEKVHIMLCVPLGIIKNVFTHMQRLSFSFYFTNV